MAEGEREGNAILGRRQTKTCRAVACACAEGEPAKKPWYFPYAYWPGTEAYFEGDLASVTAICFYLTKHFGNTTLLDWWRW